MTSRCRHTSYRHAHEESSSTAPTCWATGSDCRSLVLLRLPCGASIGFSGKLSSLGLSVHSGCLSSSEQFTSPALLLLPEVRVSCFQFFSNYKSTSSVERPNQHRFFQRVRLRAHRNVLVRSCESLIVYSRNTSDLGILAARASRRARCSDCRKAQQEIPCANDD